MAIVAKDYIAKSKLLRKGISVKKPNDSFFVDPIPAYTSTKTSGESSPALAVFDIETPERDKKGFVIVASDDRIGGILGYSTSGSFNIDSIPDGLKWMIGNFEVSSIASNQSASSLSLSEATAPGAIDYPAIAPLVTSTWDQGDPFNRFTPTESGKHCVTGCVATSMAQLLRHFAPSGFTSEAGRVVDESYPLATFDFSERPFSWDLMRDDYSAGYYSNEEADEVARLMLACGVSVNMMYGLNESGAYTSIYMPYALTEYFSMSSDVFVAYRENYSAQEWHDLIYNELSEGRPVNYSGNSSLGGHSFICDGYDRDGLFHFNWGWSGYSDGYYNLNMLNPIDQGIGGSGAFNESQEIIGGLRVVEDRETAFPTFMNDAQVAAVKSSGDTDTFRLQGYIYYLWPSSAKVEFGMGIQEIGSDSPIACISSDYAFTFGKTDPRQGLQYLQDTEFNITIPFGLCSEAVYNVFPCYRVATTDRWRRLPLKASGNRSLTLRLDEGGGRHYTAGRFSEHPEDLEPGQRFKQGNLTFRILSGIDPDVELVEVETTDESNYISELTIPEKVTFSDVVFRVKEIAPANRVFANSGGLSKIEFPSNIEQHLDSAPDWFDDLRNLRYLNIPVGLTGLHASELKKCPRLQSLDIAENHPELEKIDGCVYFSDVSGDILEYMDNQVENCYVRSGTIKIGAGAALGNPALKNVICSDGLIQIGDYALKDCPNLIKVEAADDLQIIGRGAFSGCTNLHAIYLGKSLASIDRTAFEGCEDIREIHISGLNPPIVTDGETVLSEAECRDLFEDPVYRQCSLVVPEISINQYRAKSPWSFFKSIKPYASGSVEDKITESIKVKAEAGTIKIGVPADVMTDLPFSVYSVDGLQVAQGIVRSGEERLLYIHAIGLYFCKVGEKSIKVMLTEKR